MSIGDLNLCKPAFAYLVISSIVILVMIFQNIGSRNIYCVGSLSCDVPSLMNIFMIKILYIVFWTWILNVICKNGAIEIAWFLVLLPFLLLFLPILFMMGNLSFK
jgi:hypothetical protein